MRWAILTALLLLGGCVTRVEFITPELELPPMPVLPVLADESQTDCLTPETYEVILRREMRLKGHIAVLRAIIEENNRVNER